MVNAPYIVKGYWDSGYVYEPFEDTLSVNDAQYTLDVGKAYAFSPAQAFSADQITYSISPSLPNGLQIDPFSGIIYGSAKFITANTKYTISMTTVDRFGTYDFYLEAIKSTETFSQIEVLELAQSRIALQYRAR
jgi:hypothetical protein